MQMKSKDLHDVETEWQTLLFLDDKKTSLSGTNIFSVRY